MIGIDSSVVIQYIAKYDERYSQDLAKKAETFVDSLSAECPGFITLISLVEMVRTLQGGYLVNKGQVIEFIETLLRSKEVIVENAEVAWQAVRAFSTSDADFAACLNERIAYAAGCRYTVSIDFKAAKNPGIRSL